MNPVSFPVNVPAMQVASSQAVDGASPSAGTSAAIGTLMPEPTGADIGLVIAQLVIENAFTARKQARQDRQHANAAMIASQKEQIAQMRQEADRRYEAARLEAFGKIGEGLFGVAGGAISASGLFGIGGKMPTDDSSASSASEVLQARSGWGSATESVGKVGSGITGLLAADGKRDADRASAAAKAAEMEATAQKDAIENADDEIKEAREHIRTALDFLRDFQAAQTKAMSSAIRG